MKMLNQDVIPAYLINELPEITVEFKYIYPSVNIFKIIQCLSNFTMRKLMQRDWKAVKKCFIVAGNIYSQGNAAVKIAVENIFIFSFSSLMSICNKDEKIELQAVIPMYLYSAYVQQLLQPGI